MQQDNTIPQNGAANDTNSQLPTPQAPQYSGNNKSPKKQGAFLRFLSNFGVLIAAPLIAILLIQFVFQSYEVDGPSMQQTLQDKDRLVVVKLGKTISEIRDQDYIPDRSSIIIFHKVDSQDTNGKDRQLVKRVIGLPGDRVIIRDGEVKVINDQFPDGFDPDKLGEYQDNVDPFTPGNVDITVPFGEVFVLGDNRDNSSDSRIFGTVRSEHIVGELVLRIFPFNSFKSF